MNKEPIIFVFLNEKVTATLTYTNFHSSPLVQGGLKIACKVTAKMPSTTKNHTILDRFKELLNVYYTEPTDDELIGSFLAIISYDSPIRTQKTSSFQREKKKQSNPEINVPDIRVKCSITE